MKIYLDRALKAARAGRVQSQSEWFGRITAKRLLKAAKKQQRRTFFRNQARGR